MALEATDAELALAKAAADKGDWMAAIEHYEAAAKELPTLNTPERVATARRIRLSAAKAKLNSSQLVAARRALKDLVKELGEDPSTAADP